MSRAALPAALGVALIGLWPLLFNGLPTYDDVLAIVDNPHIRSFDLKWMLTSVEKGAYEPLAWLVFSFIHAVSGLRPVGFHAASLLVHLASGALVYALARRLAKAGPWAAAAAALAFLLHPLQIETVAQAASLGDVLASFFALASVLFFLEDALWLSLGYLVASALCHWQGAALPLVFVLLDRGFERRRHLPFFAVSALLVIVSAAVKVGGAREAFPLALAPANLAREAAFFLTKTVAPVRLTTLHYLSGPLAPRTWPFWPSLLALAAITAAAARKRAVLTGWLSYLLLLAPTSALVWGGNFAVSSRYGYLAFAALALLLAAALERAGKRAALPAAAVLALALVPAARVQARVWHDGASILARDVRSDPQAPMTNLKSPEDAAGAAMRLMEDGRPDEALILLTAAVAAKPDDARMRNDYGVLLASRGKMTEAVEQFEAAVRLDPASAAAKANLARARASK